MRGRGSGAGRRLRRGRSEQRSPGQGREGGEDRPPRVICTWSCPRRALQWPWRWPWGVARARASCHVASQGLGEVSRGGALSSPPSLAASLPPRPEASADALWGRASPPQARHPRQGRGDTEQRSVSSPAGSSDGGLCAETFPGRPPLPREAHMPSTSALCLPA